jgi:hypothetical protein
MVSTVVFLPLQLNGLKFSHLNDYLVEKNPTKLDSKLL